MEREMEGKLMLSRCYLKQVLRNGCLSVWPSLKSTVCDAGFDLSGHGVAYSFTEIEISVAMVETQQMQKVSVGSIDVSVENVTVSQFSSNCAGLSDHPTVADGGRWWQMVAVVPQQRKQH